MTRAEDTAALREKLKTALADMKKQVGEAVGPYEAEKAAERMRKEQIERYEAMKRMSGAKRTMREELADPETRWCPMYLASPRKEEQEILLYVPGVLDEPVPVRFGDIWWTEVEE